MDVRLLAVPVFAGLFGLMFVGLGLRRMIGSVREPRPAAAMFWGIVGVLIGVGVFAGLWYVGQSILGETSRPVPFHSSFPPIPAPH